MEEQEEEKEEEKEEKEEKEELKLQQEEVKGQKEVEENEEVVVRKRERERDARHLAVLCVGLCGVCVESVWCGEHVWRGGLVCGKCVERGQERSFRERMKR